MNVVESNSGRALMVVLGGINVKFGTELEIFFSAACLERIFLPFHMNNKSRFRCVEQNKSNFKLWNRKNKQINKKTEGWGWKINFSRQCFFLSNTLKFAD